MLLLYLDFDGVLHHEDVRWSPKRGAYMNAPGEQLFAYADLLGRQLLQLPDLRIVLSTSWAVHYGFSRAAKRLPEGLRRRAIGATWHSQMNRQVFDNTPRGLQVSMTYSAASPPPGSPWTTTQRVGPRGPSRTWCRQMEPLASVPRSPRCRSKTNSTASRTSQRNRDEQPTPSH